MADAPVKIVVLEGDETGQELLDQALRVLDPGAARSAGRARAVRPLARRSGAETSNGSSPRPREAMKAAGFGIKAATITPEGKDDVGSPEPHPARGGRRQGDRPHRPAHPGRRRAGGRRPLPDLRRAHGRRGRLRRQAVARGRWTATRSPTGPSASRAPPAARSPSSPSGRPSASAARVYGGPKWTVSPVYEGMLKEEMDAAAERHPDVAYQPRADRRALRGPDLRARPTRRS